MTVEARSWPEQRTANPAGTAVSTEARRFGPPGYLFLLLWTLALVLLVPPERTLLAAAVALLAGIACRQVQAGTGSSLSHTRGGFRRGRWLLFGGLMMVPVLISAVEIGPGWQVEAVAWDALGEGVRMLVRALVIMSAANSFATSVSVSEIAALFERAGVRGLGFALGVAVNLLPVLQQTMRSTWHSMRMRGGFRRQRLQHLRLFLATLIVTTLRRAETIALAAETRAYTPEDSHPVPIANGTLDASLMVTGTGIFLLLVLL
jgi:energy-coupling factor transporter transmembrane protein EcfT